MRVAFIGNCQVQTLAVLSRVMLDASEIRVFDYSEPYSRIEANRQRFAENLTDCDWIFAQTALLNYTSERDLRPIYGGKLITIANFYFRGLFPDSCYIGDYSHRVSDPIAVNSILVLDAYRRGLSEAGALRQFAIDVVERLGLLDAWPSSMDEMRRREANGSVDVRAADLMEEACRQYPAFLTMNHPGAPLLADYLRQVFSFAGINHGHVNALKVVDPLAEHDTTPILDEVAEHYRLPYRVSQKWKINAMGRRFIGREEFIAVCYEAYRRCDPERLLVHSPTDLVAALKSDPSLAYLVDHTVAAPIEADRHDIGYSMGPLAIKELVRDEVGRAVRPLADSVEEIRHYTHKVHSYLEVIDPKVERLIQYAEHADAVVGLPAEDAPPLTERASHVVINRPWTVAEVLVRIRRRLAMALFLRRQRRSLPER